MKKIISILVLIVAGCSAPDDEKVQNYCGKITQKWVSYDGKSHVFRMDNKEINIIVTPEIYQSHKVGDAYCK
jgi:hypothetical protein